MTTLPPSYSNCLEILGASTSWISLLFLLVLGCVCVCEREREREKERAIGPVIQCGGYFLDFWSVSLSVVQTVKWSLSKNKCTRVGTLIVATIYLHLIQNRYVYMFRSFTVLQCSHQHFVQPVASDVEVVGYL